MRQPWRWHCACRSGRGDGAVRLRWASACSGTPGPMKRHAWRTWRMAAAAAAAAAMQQSSAAAHASCCGGSTRLNANGRRNSRRCPRAQLAQAQARCHGVRRRAAELMRSRCCSAHGAYATGSHRRQQPPWLVHVDSAPPVPSALRSRGTGQGAAIAGRAALDSRGARRAWATGCEVGAVGRWASR
eukprot:355279-Chlamydomonas_euryale.AAC.5